MLLVALGRVLPLVALLEDLNTANTLGSGRVAILQDAGVRRGGGVDTVAWKGVRTTGKGSYRFGTPNGSRWNRPHGGGTPGGC